MKNQKLSLKSIKVKSFVTELNNSYENQDPIKTKLFCSAQGQCITGFNCTV